MDFKSLMELIANLHIKDENGEILRVKQIIVKHYKSVNRAKTILKDLYDDYMDIQKALKELKENGIIWIFVLDSYYGNEYLKLYIIKLIDENPKTIEKKPKLRVIKNEEMGTDT